MVYHNVSQTWEVSPESTIMNETNASAGGRLFPTAYPCLGLKRTTTLSIPIAPTQISQSDIELEQGMAIAERKEIAMMQRILHGKKNRMNNPPYTSLKNELKFQHGHRINEDKEATSHYEYKLEQKRIMRHFDQMRYYSQCSFPYGQGTTNVNSSVSEHDVHEESLPSEQGIFDLEM
jgi:hypothetical protein